MTGSRRRPWARRIFGFGLASLALLLGGCVFLRLLAFKHQLAAFDRNFTLDTRDGVHLACLNPVLLSGDFRWLGITPESTQTLGHSEQWRVRWVKQLPPGVTESVVRDVEVGLIFTDDKLTRLSIPERYFAVISKRFFVGLLRGLGAANVDKDGRTAAVDFSRSNEDILVAQVTATAFAMLLGPPSEQRVEGARTVLRYRYVPTPPGARNGIFDLAFSFDTVSGQLLFLQARSPVGQLSFNFDPSTAPTPPAAPPALAPKP